MMTVIKHHIPKFTILIRLLTFGQTYNNSITCLVNSCGLPSSQKSKQAGDIVPNVRVG
jgi:hypothetical protein